MAPPLTLQHTDTLSLSIYIYIYIYISLTLSLYLAGVSDHIHEVHLHRDALQLESDGAGGRLDALGDVAQTHLGHVFLVHLQQQVPAVK